MGDHMKDALAGVGIIAITTGLGMVNIPVAIVFVGIVVITVAVFWGFIEQRQKGVADDQRQPRTRSGDSPS